MGPCRCPVIAAIVPRCGRGRRHPELPPPHDQVVTTITGARQTIPAACREPGGDQGAGARTGRLPITRIRLTRSRIPTGGRELGPDPFAPGDQLLDAAHLRPHGRRQAPGLRDRGGDGSLLAVISIADAPVSAATSRHRPGRDRTATEGWNSASALRFGNFRQRHHPDFNRCGGLVPRFVHEPRRHDGDVQHAAWGSRTRRNRIGPLRNADPRGDHRFVAGLMVGRTPPKYLGKKITPAKSSSPQAFSSSRR